MPRQGRTRVPGRLQLLRSAPVTPRAARRTPSAGELPPSRTATATTSFVFGLYAPRCQRAPLAERPRRGRARRQKPKAPILLQDEPPGFKPGWRAAWLGNPVCHFARQGRKACGVPAGAPESVPFPAGFPVYRQRVYCYPGGLPGNNIRNWKILFPPPAFRWQPASLQGWNRRAACSCPQRGYLRTGYSCRARLRRPVGKSRHAWRSHGGYCHPACPAGITTSSFRDTARGGLPVWLAQGLKT
jgi:hypothetical protein